VVPAERFHVAAAVYGVLIEADRVLLLRRTGSGYRDGQLSLPAGTSMEARMRSMAWSGNYVKS
jgi:8-oxo-dGTP pyrophosphatase MutT (NUDIX family)